MNARGERALARLEVRQLRVSRGGRVVLQGIDLQVGKGEAVSISGPSGSGKTTLLRVLALLDRHDAGEILLDGEGAHAMPFTEYRRRVSLVFQEPPMFEGTVADNVRYGPRLRGVELDDSAVLAHLERACLPVDLVGRAAQELSGGEKQRVALARAMANDPDVLLLDEPTSALDPRAAQGVIEHVRDLAARGLSVVAVLHNREHARQLGDIHLVMGTAGLVVETTS